MCRTVIIFNVHCEHEHAEIMKCSRKTAAEQKWHRKGYFSKMFSLPPGSCRRPQQTRNITEAQVCPHCSSLGITYETIRKDLDAAQRRPPRPIYRNQTDLSFGSPDSPPGPQRMNTFCKHAECIRKRQERSNAVQFHGEAPRLPHVRATAIFRESQNPLPETLRQYLGPSGVPSEGPESTDYQRPPPASTNRRNRHRPHSDRHQPRSSSPHPYDNGASQYMDRPLPPPPLRPRRAASSASRPPPVPDRSSSQRRPRSPSERQSDIGRSSSQQPPELSNDWQQGQWRYSSQWPPEPSNPLALTRYVPPSPPHVPSYHRGMPTDRELNRMSREIESVESAWVNAGRRSSQQQPVQRESTGSPTAPRRHRSQREGKYA